MLSLRCESGDSFERSGKPKNDLLIVKEVAEVDGKVEVLVEDCQRLEDAETEPILLSAARLEIVLHC